MVLGINPGGDSQGESAEQACGYIQRILNPKGGPFCSITSGENGEQAAENQRYATRVRAYIGSILGWPQPLSTDRRFTLVPLGNINPYRSPNIDSMDELAWTTGINLGIELLSMAQPRCLLLIGTGDGRSAWGVIRNLILEKPTLVGRHDNQGVQEELLRAQKNIQVQGAKQCFLRWPNTGATTHVVALAHPRVPISNADYDRQLKALSNGFPEWKKIRLNDPYKLILPPVLIKKK